MITVTAAQQTVQAATPLDMNIDVSRCVRTNAEGKIEMSVLAEQKLYLSPAEPDSEGSEWREVPQGLRTAAALLTSTDRPLATLISSYLEACQNRTGWRDMADRKTRDLHSALAAIGEALMREAEDRGWCDEYDSFVEQVNRELAQYGAELPVREQDFEIEVGIFLNGNFISNADVTVRAQTEEQAYELVFDDPESYLGDLADFVIETIRSGYHDITIDSSH